MFKDINTMLDKITPTSEMLQSPEYQILTGWFEKPKGFQEKINKIKRRLKYKR